MIRTQIYLPQSQLNRLKKEAQNKSTSVSEVLRELVDQRFEQVRSDTTDTSLARASARIAGRKKGGPKDLAQNLDRYLYGES
jgi:predicted CopG family antitoxin